jgi:hypothetical protein
MSTNLTPDPSKVALWIGRILSGLLSLFLLADGAMKLARPESVVEATVKLGFPESAIAPLGVVLVTCTVLYIVSQTAVLGVVLLTGYLGGAVATHVHVGHGAFEILFPVFLGALLWGGLWLRDVRLRAILPRRQN